MEEEPEIKEYRSPVARGIAAASGAVAMAILCCGDVTVSGLRRGFRFLGSHTHDNKKKKSTRKSVVVGGIHRVNNFTKMLEAMATWILSWVVSLTRCFAGLMLNSKPANSLINLLPAEIVHATLHSFNKIWDAVEVSRKNVMSTLSGSTTELVSQRYGETAGRATEEALEAAAHVMGAATAVTTAIHPKNAISPASLAKASAPPLHKKDT